MKVRVDVLSPPNETLLSSMLHEGYVKIVSECGEEADQDCLRNVLTELGEKEVRFGFVGNDIKHTLGKILKKYKAVMAPKGGEVREKMGFQDLINFLASLEYEDLVVDVKLSDSKDAILVGTRSFVEGRDYKERGYSFQIMKADRYVGISSVESGTFWEQVTPYADLSGLLLFFTGLASSYVTSIGANDYCFLFFDTETLLNRVLGGNIKNWMVIKESLSEKIKERIEEYGGINDEAITLSVLYNVSLLEELRRSQVKYVGFRLVRVSREGNTYKVYDDIPLRVYPGRRLYENPEEEKRTAEEINRIIDVLVRSASKFVKGSDKIGDGYHAFKALRYLHFYVSTENPSYLNMMYRELHEAYTASKRGGDPRAERYLECFLRPTAKP